MSAVKKPKGAKIPQAKLPEMPKIKHPNMKRKQTLTTRKKNSEGKKKA
jgi:hypothetical protein